MGMVEVTHIANERWNKGRKYRARTASEVATGTSPCQVAKTLGSRLVGRVAKSSRTGLQQRTASQPVYQVWGSCTALWLE